MQPRSLWIGLAIGLCALLAVALIPRPQNHVAVLERIAPRIERAQVLAPEARAAIAQLLERVRETEIDPRIRVRRELAIQRVSAALDARAEPASVGQAPSDR